ncbi:hypothetical protein EV182_003675 [Spiromyces aspiralis]|uniref:Uncharacterized protein n=1 Tax=Spiromyces aspiralis TaxID=68401 RepID=A0ACC1HGL7_9FUNG|nr:hypothetical protein EV182_003675 [Spiromyces aspiralis]
MAVSSMRCTAAADALTRNVTLGLPTPDQFLNAKGADPEETGKIYAPTGTQEDARIVDLLLGAYESMLGAVVPVKRRASEAQWIDEDKSARVDKPMGNIAATYGFTRRQRLHLLPEETLYLAEKNQLLLGFPQPGGECGPSGVLCRLSRAQMWSLMLERQHLTIPQYQVYSLLKRLGFIPVVGLSLNVTVAGQTARPSSWLRACAAYLAATIAPALRRVWELMQHTHRTPSFSSFASAFEYLRKRGPRPATVNSALAASSGQNLPPRGSSYNVYRPSANYRKKSPGIPSAIMSAAQLRALITAAAPAVAAPSDAPTAGGAQASTNKPLQPISPYPSRVVFGISEEGSTSFLSFKLTTTPNIPHKGPFQDPMLVASTTTAK